MGVPRIEKDTVEFPVGGSAVSIGEDVEVVRGLDYGDVAARGVAIVVFNGKGMEVKPESATERVISIKSDESQNPKPKPKTPAVREGIPNW